MNILIQYGWTYVQDQYYKHYPAPGTLPGRIVSIKGFKFHLVTENGEKEAELSGKILFGAEDGSLPVVGDWVLFLDYATGYIVDIFPRTSSLVRRDPGTTSGTQLLAANIEVALIVQGLDRDFNPRRIERYVVQVTACNIRPVVILSKSDLIPNAEDYVTEIEALQRDCSIYVCSTLTGAGVDAIRSEVLKSGVTSILVGSSGAGKSSLLNALVYMDLQKTGAVSSFNQKGKHTTSTRDLFILGNGSLIIDSPGMREFGLTSTDTLSSAELFPALEAFAAACKYSDCTHITETSCGVREALKRGALSEEVYNNYVKLLKEQQHFERSAAEKKRTGKKGAKMVREAKDFKRRFKGGG